MKNLFLCLSAFILLSTTAATTLHAEADQRIKKALDELDVKYMIDDDGDYAITIAYEAEGRFPTGLRRLRDRQYRGV